jgi:phosphate starvation-inducible PhoH-like protein
LGYLPGTLEEKMAPWVRPIYDILYNFISPKEVTYLMEEKIIEISPLGYMRGRTFKNCWIVADEMQNSSVSQMKMLLQDQQTLEVKVLFQEQQIHQMVLITGVH